MQTVKRGILTVVSGFAGTGKGTVVKELCRRFPDEFVLSVSATTRPPRPREVDGREYFFKTAEQFEEMIRDGQLLEYANYVGNYYGTPRPYVEEQLKKGRNVILEIEIKGAYQIREIFPEALLIFLMPPDAAELRRRLTGRNTESPEVITQRLLKACIEAGECRNYDYLLVNDRVDSCAEKLAQIVRMQSMRMERNRERLESFAQELRTLLQQPQAGDAP